MKSCHATTGLEPEIMICEIGQAWGAGHGLTHAESQTNSMARILDYKDGSQRLGSRRRMEKVEK